MSTWLEKHMGCAIRESRKELARKFLDKFIDIWLQLAQQ